MIHFCNSNSWLKIVIFLHQSVTNFLKRYGKPLMLITYLVISFQKFWKLSQKKHFLHISGDFGHLTLNLVQIWLIWWFFLMNHTNFLLKDDRPLLLIMYLIIKNISWKLSQKCLLLHFLVIFNSKFATKFCSNTTEFFFDWMM